MDKLSDTIGPYQIHEEIGRGGMAIVYRATETATGRIVALKVLPPHLAHDQRYLQRFLREGHHAEKLDHPNLVRIYSAGSSAGYHYLALQYIDGPTLTEYLRAQPSLLEPRAVVDILAQVAAGLDYAHSQGFLHRDIKPGNILLTQDNVALLTDFGVAKVFDDDMTAVTQIGSTVGTPAFMSPEQARGAKLDHRADIYSLGVVAYTMLAGKMPFNADSQPEMLHKIVYDAPRPAQELNASIPPGMLYALDRVLAKDPPMRYASASAFTQALEEGLTWVPSDDRWPAVSAAKPSGDEVIRADGQARRRWLAPLLLLVMAALIGSAFFFLGGSQLSNPDGAGQLADVTRDDQSVDVLTLRTFQNNGSAFEVSVPFAWPLTEQANGNVQLFNFDAPDRIARIFVAALPEVDAHSQDRATSDSGPHIENALGRLDLPYLDLQPSHEATSLSSANGEGMAQEWTAVWLGRPVLLRLAWFSGDGDGDFLIGTVVEEKDAARFAPAHTAIVESFAMTSGENIAMDATKTSPRTAEEIEDSSQGASGGTDASVDPPSLVITPTVGIEGSPTSIARAGQASVVAPTSTAFVDAVTPTRTQTPTADFQAGAADGALTGSGIVSAFAQMLQDVQTLAPVLTETPRPTVRATHTPTFQPTVAASFTATATAIPTLTSTASATATATNTPTIRPTATQMPTSTPLPTNTPTATATTTPSPTRTPTQTATQRPTSTPVPTHTATPLPSPTPSPTRTPTSTPVATPTSTATPRPTNTPRPTATSTEAPLTATIEPPSDSDGQVSTGYITSFEPFGNWRIGDQKWATFDPATDLFWEGSAAGRISYDFPASAGSNDFVVFLAEPPIPLPGNANSLTIEVFGDGSDNYLNTWIADSAGHIWQFTFGQISHEEWAPMTTSLTPNQDWPNGPIQGDAVTALTPPLRLFALVVDGNREGNDNRGEIVLDAIRPGMNQGAGVTVAAPSDPTPVASTAAAAPIGDVSGRIAVPIFNGSVMDTYVFNAADGAVLKMIPNMRQPDINGSLLVANGHGGGTDSIFRMGVDGANQRQVSIHPEDNWPQWSPSADSIVYGSTHQGDGRWRLYWQVDASDIFDAPPMSYSGREIFGQFPVYLDNWRIAYQGCNTWAGGSSCGIYTTDTSGGQPNQVTTSTDDIPTANLGNQILFMSKRDGDWDIYLVNWDGGGFRQLTNDPGVDVLATAAPGYGQIGFVSNRTGSWAVYVMNVDGGEVRKLFDLSGGFGSGEFDVLRERITWGP